MRARLSGFRHSLFLKVYLTLLASLALVALAAALVVRLSVDERSVTWDERRDRVLAELLPLGADAAALKDTIERLARGIGGDLALVDAKGRVLAAAGEPFPPGILRQRRLRRSPDGMVALLVDLPDGRILAARLPAGAAARNPLLLLAAVALAIGVAAYPVVRHLTRRLERLRRGVEAWGGGRLESRLEVDGRDEVAAVAKTFNRAAEEVERLLSSHRALLAHASHELRSPLARLRMAVELRRPSPEPGGAEREILRNLAELDELVEEILLASRLEHGGGAEAARFSPVDLLALAAEEGARHGIPASGEAALVLGDPRLLRRLARNLMQNAVRHGAPPFSATVSAYGTGWRLAVRDGGAGLPDGGAGRVFEPFYRSPGRGEAAGGWGLGLSLVRQIAELHGGIAGHEGPPGGGAVFHVDLPGLDGPSATRGSA